MIKKLESKQASLANPVLCLGWIKHIDLDDSFQIFSNTRSVIINFTSANSKCICTNKSIKGLSSLSDGVNLINSVIYSIYKVHKLHNF